MSDCQTFINQHKFSLSLQHTSDCGVGRCDNDCPIKLRIHEISEAKIIQAMLEDDYILINSVVATYGISTEVIKRLIKEKDASFNIVQWVET